MHTLRNGGLLITLFSTFIIAIATICGAQTTPPQLLIRSADFDANAPIPTVYTCSGENRSPSLTWRFGPQGTKSYALIVEDPDAPAGIFIHWVVYNLPAGRTKLPTGVPLGATIDGGGTQGVNQHGDNGYHGPCPPPGKVHHYNFRIYALDTKLDLQGGADASAVRQAMAGHILARGDLIGTFAR